MAWVKSSHLCERRAVVADDQRGEGGMSRITITSPGVEPTRELADLALRICRTEEFQRQLETKLRRVQLELVDLGARYKHLTTEWGRRNE